MATLWNLLLVVSLLVLSASQRCSGVDHGLLEPQDVKLLSALQIINDALKCTSENIKEGLLLHEKNSEALKDLQSLPEMVLMVKEQMQVQNENMNSMKKQISALQREIGLVKQGAFSQAVAELINQLENKNKMVQVVEKRIMEYPEKEEQLNETLVQLNNTVQQYIHNKDWGSLRRGLEAVLDRSSEPYRQLQRVEYSDIIPLYNVGYSGSTELASLLLDAGLPVDTADADSSGLTMLHGAAYNGHLELVKLLLDRGASIDMRNTYDETPLMYAALGGKLKMVQHLVSAGADTTATDSYSRTALEQARMEGRTTVVQYLEQLPH